MVDIPAAEVGRKGVVGAKDLDDVPRSVRVLCTVRVGNSNGLLILYAFRFGLNSCKYSLRSVV